MYQLVKGRETVRERPLVARKPQTPEPLTRPIQPWVDPDPIRRSWIERFGMAAAGLGLIALSIITASWSVRVPTAEPIIPPVGNQEAAPAEVTVAAPAKEELHPPMPAAHED